MNVFYDDTCQPIHVDQQAFAFDSAGTFYVGNDGGLFRTSDRGSHWQNVNGNLGITQFWPGLSLHPTDAAFIIGGTQDNRTVRLAGILPNNSLQCFFLAGDGDGGHTAIDPDDPQTLYVYSYGPTSRIERSEDGGATFKTLKTFDNWNTAGQGFAGTVAPLMLDPTDSHTLLFATDRVFQSTNRGDRWAPISPALAKAGNGTASGEITSLSVSPADSATIYAGTHDGAVWVTRNRGTSWQERSAGLPGRIVETVAVHPSDPLTAYVGLAGFGPRRVLRTRDAGATWQDVSGNLPDEPMNALRVVVESGITTVVAASERAVYRSIGGGASWHLLGRGMPRGKVTDLAYNPTTGYLVASTFGRGLFALTAAGAPASTLAGLEFDGDALTDVSVYRPSSGQWFIRASSTFGGMSPVTFGAAGDLPVRGDFDGDGRRDMAVYRPSTGTWFWLKSSTGNLKFAYLGWGSQSRGDVPVPGDYDGDGKTDPTVFRPAFGTWFVLESSTNYTTVLSRGWGSAGDVAVPGDYDGDGISDMAVFRPSTSQWFVLPSSAGFESGLPPVTFGRAGRAAVIHQRTPPPPFECLRRLVDLATVRNTGGG